MITLDGTPTVPSNLILFAIGNAVTVSLARSPHGLLGIYESRYKGRTMTFVDALYGDKFIKWLRTGIRKGWISEVTCWTHDSIEMTGDEWAEYEMTGEGSCMFVVRLWGEKNPNA